MVSDNWRNESWKKIEDKFMSENKYKSEDIFVNSIPMYLEALKKRKKKRKRNAMVLAIWEIIW